MTTIIFGRVNCETYKAERCNKRISVSLTPHHFQETEHHSGIYKAHFVEKGREAARAALMIGETRERIAETAVAA